MTAPLVDELPDEQILQLHAERMQVERRHRETGTVRVAVRTAIHDHVIDEMLTSTTAQIERVPVGRIVGEMPQTREEGDTIVVPIVEEIVVTRLLLKEEVRITRVSSTRRYQDTISLRAEEAIVTRHPTTDQPTPPEETQNGQ